MNFNELNFNLSAVQWLVLTAIGIYTWLTNRQAASTQQLLELRTRIVALEEHVRHLPDQTAVTDLLGDMKAMRAELTGVKDALAPLARSLDRINDYLLREKQ
jgi:Tfp pilus assembly protein PilN